VDLDPDAARSDLVLTGAMVLVVGPLLLAARANAAIGGGAVLGTLVDVAVVLATTVLVPLLLARHRGDGARAFAWRPSGATLVRSLPLALPAVVLGPVALSIIGAPAITRLLGRLGGDDTLSAASVTMATLRIVSVAALAAGSLLLVAFLAVRARDAFPRSRERTLTELLRTGGMLAALVALIAGLARALGGASVTLALVNALALAATVLVADRMLPARERAPQAAIIAPAVVALVAHVGSAPGGLVAGIEAGALAAGITVVMATLALSAAGSVRLVALVVAVHLWPTCLSPLRLASGVC
jgi:hypothetical protein